MKYAVPTATSSHRPDTLFSSLKFFALRNSLCKHSQAPASELPLFANIVKYYIVSLEYRWNPSPLQKRKRNISVLVPTSITSNMPNTYVSNKTPANRSTHKFLTSRSNQPYQLSLIPYFNTYISVHFNIICHWAPQAKFATNLQPFIKSC